MTNDAARWRRLGRRMLAKRPRARTELELDGSSGEATDARLRRLVDSPLFDDAWYAMCLGRDLDRQEAAAHYLRVGYREGLAPHPLFDPTTCARALELEEGVEPLGEYLSRQLFAAPVHPLFDVAGYVAKYPQALEHAAGPVGHYEEEGSREGARPNAWYQPRRDQPRGLRDWAWGHGAEWAARRRLSLPTWSRVRPDGGDPTETEQMGSATGLVTVVMVVESGGEDLAKSVTSLQSQSGTDWELLLLWLAGAPRSSECDLPDDARIRLIEDPFPTRWAARNHATSVAAGKFLTWMIEGDTWKPERITSLWRGLGDRHQWVQDCARDSRPEVLRRHASRPYTLERLLAGASVELSTLMVERELVRRVGGFDEGRSGGRVLDFLLKLHEHDGGAFVSRLGVVFDRGPRREGRRAPANVRPFVDFDKLPSASDAVLNDRIVDWSKLEERQPQPGLVSVIIPTHHDWELTSVAVQRVVECREPHERTEVVIVDNGCPLVSTLVLCSLAEQFEDVLVQHNSVNRGFALGNNTALELAGGDIVVFLNNDTEVQPGWLAPLRAALQDESVLGVQSLLLYPGGEIQSAGVAFPRGGGIPYMLLNGFHAIESAGLEEERLPALTGAAMALRMSDILAMRGFDPLYRNGMEDVDVCLRLQEYRAGHFVVAPKSQVIHHESQSSGRFGSSINNRRVFLDRWVGRWPHDDEDVWRRRGFDVLGHRIDNVVSEDRRLCVAEPVLARRPRLEVREGVPRMRWALKNPAPFGSEGERWGDTHFARQLGSALEEHGQEVAIDHRGAFHRSSEWLDDVVLLLRGLAPYTPVPDRVNLMWVISHPDMLERREHIGWDRIYVASAPFADKMARDWGAPATPLWQATDPARFRPSEVQGERKRPLLFVGNSRKQYRTLVKYAIEQQLPVDVIGAGWEGLIPSAKIKGQYIPNHALAAEYRAADVVLNDHWQDMYEQGFLSNRLFDAVASGARVVSDDVPGLKDLFGEAVQTVASGQELAKLVVGTDLDAVFGTEDERRERAAWVAAEHSFSARARVLVEDAARVWAHRRSQAT